MQLDPIAAEAGVRLVALGTVGSTNKEARERFRLGERGPLWITAAGQTEGRGRRGRTWISPPGNLYASLLLVDPSSPERAPELAFVAALAARDAIVAQAPELASRLAFKWPNDLLLAGEKCAGILIEGEVDAAGTISVVVGIGVNCAHHPQSSLADPAAVPNAAARGAPGRGREAILYPATDLVAHGADVPPPRLFERLSATMCLRIAQWDRGRGFSAVRDEWLSAARGLGQSIRVGDGATEMTGLFVGIDLLGRLVLELPGGAIEKITAGDVFPFARHGARAVPGSQG